MAYITKEQVQEKNKKLKELNKKYGVNGIFSGSNSSTLTLTVHEGSLDFISWYVDYINSRPVYSSPYYESEEHRKNIINQIKSSANISINNYYINDLPAAKCRDYLQDAYEIMFEGHYDYSSTMTDYLNCSWWYFNIQIGKWNKSYKFKY